MVTYNYLLPDDWVQVRLDPLDRSSVKQLTDRMFADIDDEVTRVRVSGWVTSRMTTQLEEISSQGAWTAYLPAEDPRLSPVRPMIVTRPFDMTTTDSDPMEVLVALAADSDGEFSTIEPQNMVGLKIRMPEDPEKALLDSLAEVPEDILELTTRDELLAAAAETTRLSRRVQYIIGDPSDRNRWMAIEASVSCMLAEEASTALDGVEEFFDAWVTAVSWVDEDDADESTEEEKPDE